MGMAERQQGQRQTLQGSDKHTSASMPEARLRVKPAFQVLGKETLPLGGDPAKPQGTRCGLREGTCPKATQDEERAETGNPQGRGRVGAVAAGLYHSPSNPRSEPELTAMPDP